MCPLQTLFCQQYWRFSCDLYSHPPVSEACLRLQDDYAANVNLVLFECFLLRCGVTLELAELKQVLLAIAQEDAELKLFRSARMALKPRARESIQSTGYSVLKMCELRLEKQLQATIVEAWWRNHSEQGINPISTVFDEAGQLVPLRSKRADQQPEHHSGNFPGISAYAYLMLQVEQRDAAKIAADFQIIHQHSADIEGGRTS